MNKISLYKVIHNLQLLSHLWIVQKTGLTKKPKLYPSRKKAFFEKWLKICLANKTFYDLDALVQNEQLVQRSIHTACITHVAYKMIQ